jgi:hypothetical protein
MADLRYIHIGKLAIFRAARCSPLRRLDGGCDLSTAGYRDDAGQRRF